MGVGEDDAAIDGNLVAAFYQDKLLRDSERTGMADDQDHRGVILTGADYNSGDSHHQNKKTLSFVSEFDSPWNG